VPAYPAGMSLNINSLTVDCRDPRVASTSARDRTGPWVVMADPEGNEYCVRASLPKRDEEAPA
jgi:hypothetical protein